MANERSVKIVGEKLLSLWQKSMLSQGAFAEKIGMERNNVVRLTRAGVHGILRDRFVRMAAGLERTPDELYREIGENGAIAAPTGLGEFLPAVEVEHFYGVDAAKSNYRPAVPRAKLSAPPAGAQKFFVTVDGDCMSPEYEHGDIVLFSIDEAENRGIVEGKAYFVQFRDGENTFKRIFHEDDQREVIILRPWNPKYPQRVARRSEIEKLAMAMYKLVPAK